MNIRTIILLIIAFGVGYFLCQRIHDRNRNILSQFWTRIKSLFRRYPGRIREGGYGEWQRQVAQSGRQPAQNNPQHNREAMNRPLIPASRDNITETGPMLYFANDRHGQRDKEYRFNYKKVGNGWRAYILRMPSLGGRDSSSSVIHRLHDNDGFYICWDSQVNTLKDMQTISKRWADSIQEYIVTGRFGI